jgi:hypothetical protein
LFRTDIDGYTLRTKETAMRCKCLAAALLLMATPVFAATNPQNPHQSSADLCHSERPLARQMWQRNLYAVPPAIAAIMVDATDGKTAAVRAALAGMHTQDATRWRQLAMYTAAFEGRTETVDALLGDGAAADGSVLMPPLKTTFYRSLAGQAANDPRIGPRAVKGLEAAGVMNNGARQTGPAIYMAINCDDLATAKTLLRHGADPMRGWPSHDGTDPFIAAVVEGDVDIVHAFLDHGANPCIEDRRLAERAKAHHSSVQTVAGIGQKQRLPPMLIQRLTCHAPSTSG